MTTNERMIQELRTQLNNWCRVKDDLLDDVEDLDDDMERLADDVIIRVAYCRSLLATHEPLSEVRNQARRVKESVALLEQRRTEVKRQRAQFAIEDMGIIQGEMELSLQGLYFNPRATDIDRQQAVNHLKRVGQYKEIAFRYDELDIYNPIFDLQARAYEELDAVYHILDSLRDS